MDEENHTVSSELFEENDYNSDIKPLVNKSNCVSKFMFTYPPNKFEVDHDGDLIVTRKTNEKGTLLLEHSKQTALNLVGLQVWRGALLLADWLLYKNETLPKDSIILELGSGVGLTSIIASMYVPVFCTDVNRCGILELIESNVKRNKGLSKHNIRVFELDFMSDKLPTEIHENMEKISIIIAADVIYDNLITENFLRTVERLLTSHPSEKTVYVALEKRYVFTIADCDSVAPCFDYFIECLNVSNVVTYEMIPIYFPQFFEYKRVKELVMLKLKLKS